METQNKAVDYTQSFVMLLACRNYGSSQENRVKLETALKKLRDRPDVSEWLELADQYIDMYLTNPTRFVLPKQHDVLRPLIEAYAEDPNGFVQAIQTLRDFYPRETDARYGDLNTLYRRILTRMIQRERRARTDRALLKAEKLYGPPPDAQARLAWIGRIEGEWGGRRMTMLEGHRRLTSGRRLTREETNALLESFWRGIDAEITRGEIPAWDE